MKKLKEEVHEFFCLVRKCRYLVYSDNFEVAYKAATKKERVQIQKHVKESNREAIKLFITDKLLKGQPFDQMTIKQLRNIGQHLGIKDYYKLTKADLIGEVENVAARLKKSSERKRIQSQETDTPAADNNGRG